MSLTDRIALCAARLHGLPAFPSIECQRLLLRAPQEADIQPVFELFSHPDILRYWSREAMRGSDDALAYIRTIADGFSKRSSISWIVADLTTNAMLGTCTLYDVQPSHLRCAIGYALHPQHQGHGYASEAVLTAASWALEYLHMHRVEADIHPDNHASRRVLERCGFRSEGVLRQRFVTATEIQDSEIMALLADER